MKKRIYTEDIEHINACLVSLKYEERELTKMLKRIQKMRDEEELTDYLKKQLQMKVKTIEIRADDLSEALKMSDFIKNHKEDKNENN